MSYQSKEFHKFFWAINCCTNKTQNYLISRKYFGIFAFREKVCEMRPKIYAFFHETFRSLETLEIFYCSYKEKKIWPISRYFVYLWRYSVIVYYVEVHNPKYNIKIKFNDCISTRNDVALFSCKLHAHAHAHAHYTHRAGWSAYFTA